MSKWRLGCGVVSLVVLMSMALPMRAQLPTMSDVDHGGDAPAAGPLPEWDVAVVKPTPADERGMSWRMTADSVLLRNLPLLQMICSAWDVKSYQVSGLSGWMLSNGYDLTAKVSSDDVDKYKKLNVAQRRTMLQTLLTERFQLKVHRETKSLAIYDLVVSKSGSKLKDSIALEAPSAEEAKLHPEKYRKGGMSMGLGMYEGFGVPVRSLASQLANALGKPVHDATGLTGSYDIALHFRRDENAADGGGNEEAPSIFDAVQEQLGLKLVPGKGPVETLVVDAAQKPQGN